MRLLFGRLNTNRLLDIVFQTMSVLFKSSKGVLFWNFWGVRFFSRGWQFSSDSWRGKNFLFFDRKWISVFKESFFLHLSLTSKIPNSQKFWYHTIDNKTEKRGPKFSNSLKNLTCPIFFSFKYISFNRY